LTETNSAVAVVPCPPTDQTGLPVYYMVIITKSYLDQL